MKEFFFKSGNDWFLVIGGLQPRLKRYPAATRYPELSGKRISAKREQTLRVAEALRSI
ncbi:hypothetical protein ACFSR6_17990 [Pedobacter vanadiisoli]|uniref:Uncharacterized protein n=1 Tax=Pedobacter vanadiisoli TaxID=1761975 RepID=A0ABW5MNE3_9SPHI